MRREPRDIAADRYAVLVAADRAVLGRLEITLKAT